MILEEIIEACPGISCDAEVGVEGFLKEAVDGRQWVFSEVRRL